MQPSQGRGYLIWKENRKTSAAFLWMAHSAAHANRAAKTVHNPRGCPQAQSCALFSFGGKEWLVDMRSQVWRDSVPIVDQGYTDAMKCGIPPVGGVAGAKRNAPP